MREGFAALAALCLAACASGPDLTPKSGIPADARLVVYKGVTFNAGDHVRIKSRAGTFKPTDTGYSIEVGADPGKTGIVLGGMKRAEPLSASEPIQIVLVRFDPQNWTDASSARAPVPIASFEATIHADYLELLK